MRVLEFVCEYWNLYACIGICMRVLEFVCVYWNLYACLYLWATVKYSTCFKILKPQIHFISQSLKCQPISCARICHLPITSLVSPTAPPKSKYIFTLWRRGLQNTNTFSRHHKLLFLRKRTKKAHNFSV